MVTVVKMRREYCVINVLQFWKFFCDFFCRACTQCIHEDMSYLYTGRWRTLRLAGAWARSFCDAAHRWGDRPWDLIFSGTLLVLVPKFENVAPDFDLKSWKSSSSWKIPSRTTSLKDLEVKDSYFTATCRPTSKEIPGKAGSLWYEAVEKSGNCR